MRARISYLCVLIVAMVAAPPKAAADRATDGASSESTPQAPATPQSPPPAADLVPPALEELLTRALSVHPRIGAAKDRVEASRARARGAGALDDPFATVAYQNDGLTSVTLGESEDSQIALGFAQPLPGRGKRELRTDAATKEADADESLVRIEELALRRSAVSAWWRLAYEQEVRASLADQKTVADLVESLALARYGAGQGAQVDVLRAQLAQTRLGESLEISAESAAGLREELRGQLAMDPSETLPDPGALPEPSGARIDPDEAVARALAQSPDLARLASAAVAADARVALARGDYRADYVLGGAYMYRGSAYSGRYDPMVAVSLGVRLPVHRAARLDPAVAAAAADATTLRSGTEAQRLLLATRTRQRLAAIRAAAASERILREGVIPQDHLVVDSALATYRSGRGEILPVLSALETLLADRLEHARRLLEIATECIALETFSLDPPAAAATLMPRPAVSAALVSGSSGMTAPSAGAAPQPSPAATGMGAMR
jgi:cobalt-zinc-cadmium efflux system outer membrane protein